MNNKCLLDILTFALFTFCNVVTIPKVFCGQYENLIQRADIFHFEPSGRSRYPSGIKIDSIGQFRAKTEEIKIIVHGYDSGANHVAIAPLRNAYLSKGYPALFIADWSDASKVIYFTSRYFVPRVAKRFARILNDFLRKQDIEPGNVHIIGHSLGAHIAGGIGRRFNGTIGRITALDPAAPLFEDATDAIQASDGQFVDVIHTDWPAFGLTQPVGHVDFYPNYGRDPQPGCQLLDVLTLTSCSHYRAPIFYAESVRLPENFPAVQCPLDDILKLSALHCYNNNEEIAFMGENLPKSTRGIFFLETHNVPPYGFGAFSKNYVPSNEIS